MSPIVGVTLTKRLPNMRKVLTLALALVAFVAVAQKSQAQTSHIPGISTVMNVSPTPIGKNGIIGSVVDGYGKPVKGVELVISVVKYDYSTYKQYVDLGTSKRFGSCNNTGSSDCVQSSGQYQISLSSLPSDGNQWWLLDIRAEAPNGFVHGIWDARRVQMQVNGRPEYLSPIYMYDNGFKINTPSMQWVDKDIISIGMWLRSNYSTDVSVGFSFEGAAWTKSSVKYAQVNTSQHVENGWTWSETWFYAPQTNGVSYYNGSLCGEVQITSPYSPEWVYDNTKKVCVAAR